MTKRDDLKERIVKFQEKMQKFYWNHCTIKGARTYFNWDIETIRRSVNPEAVFTITIEPEEEEGE